MDYTTKLSNNTNPSLMERDKERQKAAEDYCHNLIGEATFGMYVAHKAGSKWADEHPINYDGKAMLYVNQKSHDNGYKEAVDKACEWLEEFMQMTPSKKTFIKRFKQAMKGECDKLYEKYEGNPLIEENDILESFEEIINDYYEDKALY